MEFIKIASNGQWTLHKTKANGFSSDYDYMSYRKKTGELKQDFGHKGELHHFGSVRPPKGTGKNKMMGKVPQPISSAKAAENPGIGQ